METRIVLSIGSSSVSIHTILTCDVTFNDERGKYVKGAGNGLTLIKTLRMGFI